MVDSYQSFGGIYHLPSEHKYKLGTGNQSYILSEPGMRATQHDMMDIIRTKRGTKEEKRVSKECVRRGTIRWIVQLSSSCPIFPIFTPSFSAVFIFLP